MNKEEKTQIFVKKTQNMGKKLRIFRQNSTRGQPPAAKWCPTTVEKKPALCVVVFCGSGSQALAFTVKWVKW